MSGRKSIHHFCQHFGIRCFPIEVHGIYYGLTKGDPFGLDLYIRVKSLTDRWIQKISNRQRVIDDTANDMFPFPVEVKVELCDLAYE